MKVVTAAFSSPCVSASIWSFLEAGSEALKQGFKCKLFLEGVGGGMNTVIQGSGGSH